jgi:hypothetical protein
MLLEEIDSIYETAEFYQSRESGKRFYESTKFKASFSVHCRQRIQLRDHAKKFGMSAGTLESMAAGGRLSDNMSGWIRSSLSGEPRLPRRPEKSGETGSLTRLRSRLRSNTIIAK